MKKHEVVSLSIATIIGISIPYLIDGISFVILIILPSFILIPLTIIHLLACIVKPKANVRLALLIVSILPIVFITQAAAVFTVNKVQKFRSDRHIEDLEQVKIIQGQYPEDSHLILGIQYEKLDSIDNYQLRYPKGYERTAVYDSEQKTWYTDGGWD